MAYIEYGCPPLPDHELVPCGNYPMGSISSIGILLDSSDFATPADYSNSTAYTNAYNSGRMVVINNIRGTIPDASPTDIDNPVGCFSNSIVGGFDWTMTWIDANTVESNVDFYGALNKRVSKLIIYLSKSNEVMVVESATNFVCNPIVVPASNRELQQFNCTARTSFGPSGLPMKYPAPSNAGVIFTSCNRQVLASAVPSIGESIQGGLVFYVNTATNTAWVMAPEPLASNVYMVGYSAVPWSDPSVNLVSVGIPTLLTDSCPNTALIVAATTLGNPNAASLVDGVTYNGYNDWCLPTMSAAGLGVSAWELMSANLGAVLGLYPDTYWSSNQQNSTNGRSVVVVATTGVVSSSVTLKTSDLAVWPIRSFTY